jgi:hypothetical protein
MICQPQKTSQGLSKFGSVEARQPREFVCLAYDLSSLKSTEAHTMDRMLKVKLYADKELIIDNITRVDSQSSFNQLMVYRGEEVIATVDKEEVKSWWIKSGYNDRTQ